MGELGEFYKKIPDAVEIVPQGLDLGFPVFRAPPLPVLLLGRWQSSYGFSCKTAALRVR